MSVTGATWNDGISYDLVDKLSVLVKRLTTLELEFLIQFLELLRVFLDLTNQLLAFLADLGSRVIIDLLHESHLLLVSCVGHRDGA